MVVPRKRKDSTEEQDEDSLHYAALNVQSSSRRQRVTPQTDCVYSRLGQSESSLFLDKVRTQFSEEESLKRMAPVQKVCCLLLVHLVTVKILRFSAVDRWSAVAHQIQFLASVHVFVKTLNPGLGVHQTASGPVEAGRSLVLRYEVDSGTCLGPHRVHWFRQSEESAAVLYGEDQCQSDETNPTNSCFYDLHIHNVRSEQTGTYYCAVAACGQVLFGNGTRLRVREVSDMLVYVLSGVSVFSTSLVVGLSFCLCTNNNTDKSVRSAAAKTKDVAKRLQHKATEQVNRRRQSHDTWSECVYFSVEQ
uniref:Ig-like domain-containing protein n=1 Tax=Knipowitschia caucasica TaxID=637954 RepID=A0AAV2JGG2_KNICA